MHVVEVVDRVEIQDVVEMVFLDDLQHMDRKSVISELLIVISLQQYVLLSVNSISGPIQVPILSRISG
jgi:hypothetical protein